MSDKNPGIIGFPGRPAIKGGPGSFQERFENYIRDMGWKVVYPTDHITPDVILVNGSTKHFWWLLKSKLIGSAIIYRLGGINWLYKFKPENSVVKKFLISLKYLLIKITQRLLGDAIIYQSEFSKEWLIRLGQSARLKNNTIIYNGVDNELFKPGISRVYGTEQLSLICVEGNLDYTPYAIRLLNFLQERIVEKKILHKIRLYGDFENPANMHKLHPLINYDGLIPKNKINEVYQDAIYLSLDIHPACPNAVLEALSCGIPVVGFKTGALPELVKEEAGMIISYGGDPWRLDPPDFQSLADAIERVVNNYEEFSGNARRIAMDRFSINKMADNYMQIILQCINKKKF